MMQDWINNPESCNPIHLFFATTPPISDSLQGTAANDSLPMKLMLTYPCLSSSVFYPPYRTYQAIFSYKTSLPTTR